MLHPPCRDIRDPRFESLSSGQYNEEKFKKRYAFLYDEKLPAERDDLRAALARAKGQGRREELQVKLSRVEQQLRSEEARRKREGFKKQVKVGGGCLVGGRTWACRKSAAAGHPGRGATAYMAVCLPPAHDQHLPFPPVEQAKERGAVRDGKQPFYLKKSEQRRLELLAKYEELKAGGKLEAYLAKRRKRNAAKDHRHLPGDRRTQQQGGSE
jgi:ribosomal RNA-processing protein 36